MYLEFHYIPRIVLYGKAVENILTENCEPSIYSHSHLELGPSSNGLGAGCVRDRSLVYMCIIRLFRLFSRHTSGTQSFQENCHLNFRVGVVLKPLVSLMGRLVTCSSRIKSRQTDGQTERLL